MNRSVHVNIILENGLARSTPRKTHLLETAQDLFNRHGYHRTGIDKIMQASGVSKTTLYKYFRTKEDLVLELLAQRSAAILDAMNMRVSDLVTGDEEASSRERVGAIVDVISDWVAGDAFCGCNFIRAVSEYEPENEAITKLARQHKAAVKGLIREQLIGVPKAQCEQLAEDIMLIIDGAIVSAHVRERADAMASARRLINLLL